MLRAFRQNGIQGFYPPEIDEARAAARAFLRFTGAGALVVAHDARLSSPFIKTAVVKALVSEGAYVIDIGLMPLPLVGFTMRALKVPAGIMVSAAHNPPAASGLKLQVIEPNGLVIEVSRDGDLTVVESIAARLLRGEPPRLHFRRGQSESYDPRPAYFKTLMALGEGIVGLKVVADYGPGSGALTAQPLLSRLKINVRHLFTEPANHLAKAPQVEDLTALQQAVVEEAADVGLFFTGDADRVFAVAENGRLIEADVLRGILAPAALKAGRLMFAEHGGVADGLFTAFKLMRLLTKTGRPLSKLAAPFRILARAPEFSVPHFVSYPQAT